LVRGDLIKERIFAAVQRRSGQTAAVEYHGVPLIEAAPARTQPEAKEDASVPAFDPAHSAAAAMLTPKTVVFGSRISTRQVVDIFRGEEDGARGRGTSSRWGCPPRRGTTETQRARPRSPPRRSAPGPVDSAPGRGPPTRRAGAVPPAHTPTHTRPAPGPLR
jgi:hypothetical protein